MYWHLNERSIFYHDPAAFIIVYSDSDTKEVPKVTKLPFSLKYACW